MFPTLSDEQRQFIATIRELAQGEFRERAPRYQDGTFPWENMKSLAQLGVLGMAVPEEYGGLGLPVFDTALVLEEIAKACYVTAMAVLGEVGAQTRIISTYAPEAIKRRILPAVTQMLSFVMDYGMDLDAAIHQPRIDASEGAVVIGDVRLPAQTREALRARFDYEEARIQTLPMKFACPSIVLRKGGTNSGATEAFQPWGDAVAEV